MSRSYKKSPYCTDNGNSGYSKRIANRITRRKLKQMTELPQRNKYRQLYCSYDISDYKFRQTKAEVLAEYEIRDKPHKRRWFGVHIDREETLQEALNHWSKYYKRK